MDDLPTDDKPFSPACERNRDPILDVLRTVFADRHDVLEIGSGTGQHAVHFGRHLPHLHWHSSDQAGNLAGIRQWLDEARLPNTPPPLHFDVDGPWPTRRFDAVFSANTLHIMSWPQVERLFRQLPDVLAADAIVVIYGPFNVEGRATSTGNAEFDAALRVAAPHRGLRDVVAVDALAQANGLKGLQQRLLPANNRCLIWRFVGPGSSHDAASSNDPRPH